jgi:sugar/nucleoside kinase (ribokinase family)
LDTNFDASGEWGAKDGLLDTVLPLVDFFLPNDHEAMSIARTETIESAVEVLGKIVRQGVVVTCGEDGALGWLNGTVHKAPCVDLSVAGSSRVGPDASEQPLLARFKVVDPVGAGDAFNSGFLASYIKSVTAPGGECAGTQELDGAAFVKAMKQGCLAGGLCITRRGACMNPPDVEELSIFASATEYV